MKKIKVGIVGYGNLGKAVEELVAKDERFELVCVFSKRDVLGKYAYVENIGNLKKYNGKIDVVFLCAGSSSNLMEQASECLQYFCTVDAFDTHKKIKKHINDCNKTAKANGKVAFCSLGWDPGLFSLMRVLFNALGGNAYTTWGKGVSQGHSEAVRKLDNVKDAIQYTIPNQKIIKKLKCGQNVDNLLGLHTRECFVVADREYQEEIKNKIINMPNYFKGYKTTVKFVNEHEIVKHKKLYHAGEVFTHGGELKFKLKTESNPKITASVMITYSIVLYNYYKNKKYGAYSILDIPMADLLKNSKVFL